MKYKIVPYLDDGRIWYAIYSRPWWWPFWSYIWPCVDRQRAESLIVELSR